MKLPNFAEFLPKKHKEHIPHYFLALQIGKTHTKAAVWEKADEISIKKIASSTSPTDVIEQISKEYPSITQVVFGLPADYIVDNKIKESHLPELKRIAGETHLLPIGFVVVPEAIAHQLEKQTNTPQTCILLGIEDDSMTFSLFRIGKCVKIVEMKRTEAFFTDIENGLSSFDEEEILPSKIILYNGSKVLEELKEQLLSYPWQKNEKFLHVPKIEALSSDFSIESIVHAGATENQEDVNLSQVATTPQTPQENTDENKSTVPSVSIEEESVKEEKIDLADKDEINTSHEQSDLMDTEPVVIKEETHESFGFNVHQDKPVDNPTYAFTPRTPIHADEPHKKLLSLPRFSLKSLPFPKSFSIPQTRAIIPLSVLALILLSVFAFGYYFYPKATVELIAEPNIINKEITVTLNTGISTVDATNQEIPGKVYTVSVSGDSSNETTGKKIVGDKSTGDVIVYNKTSQSKTLPKGTVLGASSTVTFTLDNDVSIASASDTGESLTYGKEKVKVTASKIGPNGNIKKDTELTVGDQSKGLILAKNENDFSGGTEREISVASKDDQDKLVKTLTNSLKEEARQKLQQQLSGKEQFLPESLKNNVVDKKFDKDVGAETDNISLAMTLEFSQVSYTQDDLNKFFEEYMKKLTSDQYEFNAEKSRFDVKRVEETNDKITVTANYHAYLLPKIDLSTFSKSFAGLSRSKLGDLVTSMRDKKIVGYDVTYTRQLPFTKNKLPVNASNIKVKVVPY